MVRKMFAALGLGFALTLSGCGGGGGGEDDVVGSPAGLYEGSTADGRMATGLVLEGGNYYVVYSTVDRSYIGGFITGNGFPNNGRFTSSNAIDFNFDGGLGLLKATLFARYSPKESLNGTFTYILGGANSFTSNYNVDWELTPSLNTLAGRYIGSMGTTFSARAMDITISNTGNVSGTVGSSCTILGSATELSSGNAYGMSYTFSGTGCPYAFDGRTMTGVAYYDAASKELLSIATSDARDAGFLFGGVKS